MTVKYSTSPLLADTPIQKPQEDRLERAEFASALAKTILAMKGDESFVFGLCGPWGCGKSSVLNLILRELEKGRRKNKPIVMRFNPWWFAGQDQLMRAFLAQLGATLGRVDSGARIADLGAKLTALSKVLRPISWIPGASIVKDISDAVDSGGEAARKIGEQLTLDVNEIRQQIDSLLKSENRRIVIVMDDIDRLTAREMAQIFLIVKAVADFPKTVYLMAFDHAVVTDAIRETLGLDGVSYLEKIIQVQIDLPPAGAVALQNLFLSQLDGILSEVPIVDTAKRDFANLFHEGLKGFFTTPRAVKRLTNLLRVLFPAVHGEIYWPDFIGVAGLMVFSPRTYRLIRDNRTLFVGFEATENVKAFHEFWMNEISENEREAVTGIVERLFPMVRSSLGGSRYGADWASRWHSDLRICSPECFDRYFQLRVPQGEITEAEWNQVVGLLQVTPKIDEWIAKLCKTPGRHGLSTRVKDFLERASVFCKHKANVEQAKSMFKVLLRNGDTILSVADTDRSNLIPISNDLRLGWALQEAVERVEDGDCRQRFLKECFEEEFSLGAGTQFVWLLGAEHGRFESESSGPPQRHLVSESCVDRLVALVLERIRKAANDDSLLSHPMVLRILFDWRKFEGGVEASSWVKSKIEGDREFVWFVSLFRGSTMVHGSSDRVAMEVPTIDASGLTTWIDGIELRERSNGILKSNPEWITGEDRQALLLLLRSTDNNGKPLDPMGLRHPLHRSSGDTDYENS